jgi:catechol 2,3-dioxygenase-like lactoylglutathione lyase family enzyme
MTIDGMNHFTVLTDDLPATLEFYVGVLGLKEGWRPPLKFPGAWLYVGEQAVVHIIGGATLPPGRAGVIDHMAFTARDLPAVTELLRARGIRYDLRRQAGSGQWQLFCHDPNGARVELDFDPSETGTPT